MPEIGNAREFARYFYEALGRGAIGFAPFGMDDTGFFNYPLGAKALDAATLDAFAGPYAAIGGVMRDWAKAAFEHPSWAPPGPMTAAIGKRCWATGVSARNSASGSSARRAGVG